MKFDICMEMVLLDQPYEQRIRTVADCGFKAIEFWFHDATFTAADDPMSVPKDAAAIKQACQANGVTVNNMVVNAPDGSHGGHLVKAEDLSLYLDRVEATIAFCKQIDCNKAITCTGNVIPGLSETQMRSNLEKALSEAAKIAQKHDFTLLLEPLNTHVNHAGYFLSSSRTSAEILRGINNPSLKLLFDIYHMQIMEGNLIDNISDEMDVIGHFHSAGVPGRHELTSGEINYGAVIKAIAEGGYDGSFGLEYSPSIDDVASLKEVRAFLSGLGVEK